MLRRMQRQLKAIPLQSLPIKSYTTEELEEKLDELVVKELLYSEDRAQIDSSYLMKCGPIRVAKRDKRESLFEIQLGKAPS